MCIILKICCYALQTYIIVKSTFQVFFFLLLIDYTINLLLEILQTNDNKR